MKTAEQNRTLSHLRHKSALRPYPFDRVTVCGRFPNEKLSRPLFSIVGVIYSEYPSGPGLFDLTDCAGELFGEGWYGLESCRKLEC